MARSPTTCTAVVSSTPTLCLYGPPTVRKKTRVPVRSPILKFANSRISPTATTMCAILTLTLVSWMSQTRTCQNTIIFQNSNDAKSPRQTLSLCVSIPQIEPHSMICAFICSSCVKPRTSAYRSSCVAQKSIWSQKRRFTSKR